MKFHNPSFVFPAALFLVTASVEAVPRFETTFGNLGSGAGELIRPVGVKAAPDGMVYVSKVASQEVSLFKADGSFVRSFGKPGAGIAEFDAPYFISLSPNAKQVRVADLGNQRIQFFSRTGSFLRLINVGGRAASVEQVPDGRFLVCDATNHRVAVFSSGGSLLDSYDAGGTLDEPIGVAVLPDRRFVVTDTGNKRCVLFSQDGTVIRPFGSAGTDPGKFTYPIGVAIAPDGNIYVTDSLNDNVQVFTPDGTYLKRFGTAGSAPGQLDSPGGISILPNGRIHLAEFNNNRVSVFYDPDLKIRPTVKVRGKKKIRTSKRHVKLRGKAAAAPGTLLKKVYIKVRGKKPVAVKGGDKWSYKLRIKGSSAKAKIYSVDQLGQKSEVVRIKARRKR